MPTLARKNKYTIDVDGLGLVTYSRGEEVPEDHFEHVPGRHRMFFDTAKDDAEEDETTGPAPENTDDTSENVDEDA